MGTTDNNPAGFISDGAFGVEESFAGFHGRLLSSSPFQGTT